MHQREREHLSLQIISWGSIAVSLGLYLAARHMNRQADQIAELEEEAAVARRRKDKAEDELDGALGTITKLQKRLGEDAATEGDSGDHVH